MYEYLGYKLYGNQYGPYLISAFNGENWGFINVHGIKKIPLIYSHVSDFNDEGIARVGTGNSKNWDKNYFNIDTHGRKI